MSYERQCDSRGTTTALIPMAFKLILGILMIANHLEMSNCHFGGGGGVFRRFFFSGS